MFIFGPRRQILEEYLKIDQGLFPPVLLPFYIHNCTIKRYGIFAVNKRQNKSFMRSIN
jgi:hypothetical protein